MSDIESMTKANTKTEPRPELREFEEAVKRSFSQCVGLRVFAGNDLSNFVGRVTGITERGEAIIELDKIATVVESRSDINTDASKRLQGRLLIVPAHAVRDSSNVIGRVLGFNEAGQAIVGIDKVVSVRYTDEFDITTIDEVYVESKKTEQKEEPMKQEQKEEPMKQEQDDVFCRVSIGFKTLIAIFLLVSAILLYALRVYIDHAVEAKRLDARPLQPGEYALL